MKDQHNARLRAGGNGEPCLDSNVRFDELKKELFDRLFEMVKNSHKRRRQSLIRTI